MSTCVCISFEEHVRFINTRITSLLLYSLIILHREEDGKARIRESTDEKKVTAREKAREKTEKDHNKEKSGSRFLYKVKLLMAKPTFNMFTAFFFSFARYMFSFLRENTHVTYCIWCSCKNGC